MPTALYCELAKQPAGTPLVDYLLRAAIVTALLVGLPLVMHMLVSYRRRAAEAAEPATEPPAHGEHSAAAGGQQQEVERQTAGSRAALRPIDAAPSSSPLLLLATLGCVAFLAFEICKQIRAASGEGEGLKRIDGVVCPAAATEVIVTNNMCLLLGHLVQLHVHRTLDSVTDDHRAQLHSRFHRCVATAIERRGMRHVSLWNVKTLVIVFPYFMYMYIHLKQLAALFPSAACAALGLRRERCLCPSSPAEIWAGCVATFALGAMEKQWLVDALREQLAFYRFWLQEPGVEEALRRISEPGHRMSRDASPQPRRAAAAGDGDGGGEPSSVPLLVEQRLLSGLRQLKGERAQQHKRRQQ